MGNVDWQEQARRYEEMVEKSQNIFNPQTIQPRLALLQVLRLELLGGEKEEKAFIESVIWKTCIYGFFDQFRKLLRRCERKEEAQLELLEHLEMSIGFYLSILGQVKLDSTLFKVLRVNENHKDTGKCFDPVLVSTLFCRVGDLYRYCHSYCELEDVRMVYWENAKVSYESAAIENPQNGLPFNNLGVLYAGRKQVMTALEYYCHALKCEDNATSALMNAKSLLTHYKSSFEPLFLYKLSSSTSQENDFEEEREKFIFNTLSSLL